MTLSQNKRDGELSSADRTVDAEGSGDGIDIQAAGLREHHRDEGEVWWSEELYDLLSLDPEETEPDLEVLLDRVHPEDRPTVRRQAEAALGEDGTDVGPFTARLVRPGGEVRTVEGRFHRRNGDDGSPERVHGVVLDVTPRERLVGELRRGRRRLEEAQRVASVGSWEWDVREDEVKWSDEHYRLLGREPGDPPDPTFDDFLESVHPGDRERVEEHMTAALEEQAVPTVEYRVQHPDGTVRWMEARGTMKVEDGEVVRMMGTTLDITERVLPLRRYEALVQATSDAIVLADDEGRIAGWNDAAEEMFGRPEEEVLGEPLTIIMPQAYRERHEEGFRRFMETGESQMLGETVEFEGQRADGTVFPIELSLDSYTVCGARYFLGVVRDVTERREAQEELEAERNRLEEAQRVASVGSWEWDVISDTVTWSDEMYRLYGLEVGEPEEADFEAFLASVHPEDREEVREKAERAMETGEYPTTEWRTNPDRGPVRWLEDRGEVLEEDGEAVGIRGTVQDVTERRHLRARLEEAQRVAAVGMFERDARTGEGTWSREFYRLLGYDPEETDPELETFLERIHPEDRDAVSDVAQAALTEGEEADREVRYVTPGGEIRHGELRVRAQAEDEEVYRVYGTLQDVTDRTETQRELEEEQRRLEAAQRVGSVGSWEWDLPSDTVTWSDETYRLYGLEPGDPDEPSIGDVMDVVHPEDRDHLEGILEEAVETGDFPDFEFRVAHPDGTVRWMDARGEVVEKDPDEILMRGTVHDVTERKELEVELREREARLAESQELADLGHWRWIVETGEITASGNFYAIWGLDPDAGFTFEDFKGMVHPEDREWIQDRIAELMGGEEPDTMQFRIVRPDGTVRWVESRAVPEEEDGEVVAVRGVNQDVTDRTETQRELETERRRLEEAQQVASMGFFEWDLRSDGLHWTDELYHQMGWEPGVPEEPTIDDFLEGMHPGDRERIAAILDRPVDEQELPTFEFRIVQPDGSVRWYESRGEVIVEDGEAVRVLGTRQDITERKEMEEELRERQERLTESQELAELGHWRWDVETGEITASDTFYATWGLDPEADITFERFMEMLYPEDRERVEGRIEEALETAEPDSYQFRIARPDGKVQWMESRVVPEVEDGEVVAFRGTTQDVTDRKRMEDELREAKEAAEAANDAKSRFLANTSHEIRTPLNAIVGLTDLALDGDLSEEQRDHLEGVQSSAEHLLTIVNDVLDVSMIEAGDLALEEDPFEPREVLSGAFEVIRGKVEAGWPGDLSFDVADDVPEVVRGDAERLHQVLVNLLSNAVDFTAEGSVSARLQVADHGDPGDPLVLRFEVEDTGEGIPEEDLARLFEPFTQVDESSSREREGVGLGLSISRDLVEMMGGTIEAESTLGEGTTLRFTVEVEPATEPSTDGDPAVSPGAGAFDVDLGEDVDIRVLVAEDNAVNRKVLDGFLDRFGLESETVVNGEEALERARSRDYDVVFMDVQMPHMDGYEATRRIRSELEPVRQPHIVAVTAHASEEDRRRCLEAGMDDYLAKPVRPPAVAEALLEARAAMDAGDL